MSHPLDNPIWNALRTSHEAFSEGSPSTALRYTDSVAPFGGFPQQSHEAYEALSNLYEPKSAAVLFLNEPAEPAGDWSVRETFPLPQLVCGELHPVETSQPIRDLTASDVPAMLALTRLTDPGPFRPRTYELGQYLGIFEQGELVAMAGERFKPEGCTEVSAVCTHPRAQGKRYAMALVSAVSERILQRGEIPFLHVREDNIRARSVYEKLGFRFRRHIHLVVLAHP